MLKFNTKVLKENDEVPEAPELETAEYDKEVFALICSELKRSGYDCKHFHEGKVIVEVTSYEGKVYRLECSDIQTLKSGDLLVAFDLDGSDCIAKVSTKDSKANVTDISEKLSDIQRKEYQASTFSSAIESVDRYGFPIFEDVESGNEGPVEAGNALEKPKTTVGKEYDEAELADKEIKPDDPESDPEHMEGTTAKVDNSEKALEKSAIKPGDPEDKPKTMSEEAKRRLKAKLEARSTNGKTISEQSKKNSKIAEARAKRLAEARKLRKESLDSGNEGPVEAGNALETAKTTVGKEYDENELSSKEVKPASITKEVKPEMAGSGTSKGDGEANFPEAKIKPDEISKNKAPEVMGEDEEVVTEGAKEEKRLADWVSNGKEAGGAPDALWTKANEVYSYNTMIAKKKGKKLYLNVTKYSQTTSKLVNKLSALANDAGLEVVRKEEDFFGTSMPTKLGYGGKEESSNRRAKIMEAVKAKMKEKYSKKK